MKLKSAYAVCVVGMLLAIATLVIGALAGWDSWAHLIGAALSPTVMLIGLWPLRPEPLSRRAGKEGKTP